MEILAGLILGLTGSIHCAGMCGPIAVSLPNYTISKSRFLFNRLFYNSGRIITYALLGAVFGLLGNRLKLFGLQQTVSILTGLVIIAGVFISLNPASKLFNVSFFNKIYISFKNIFVKFYKKKTSAAFLITGMLNGFLPCGLVYLALSGAMLSGDIFSGTLFMLLFGLGTVPVMLSISLLGRKLNFNTGFFKRKLIPALSILLAVLFILRGLNLGIPYISPKLENKNQSDKEVICN